MYQKKKKINIYFIVLYNNNIYNVFLLIIVLFIVIVLIIVLITVSMSIQVTKNRNNEKKFRKFNYKLRILTDFRTTM